MTTPQYNALRNLDTAGTIPVYAMDGRVLPSLVHRGWVCYDFDDDLGVEHALLTTAGRDALKQNTPVFVVRF